MEDGDDNAANNADRGRYERRILITGGAGFIGSHVVLLFVQRYPNYFIVNLDKLDYCASVKHLEQIKDKPNYKFIQGDVCQADFVRYVLREEHIDHVLHFAAQSHVDVSYGSALDFTRTNVVGSHVLVNEAYEAGVKLFIHASTDEVYGGHSLQPLTEEAKMKPTNPYAATKAAAESIVSSYWESYKFPVIITRANNIYGPHQYPEKVIPKFVARLERNMKCCIHGDGSAMRTFLFAEDLAEAYDVLLHAGEAGQVYNIGNGFKISVLNLATQLIKQIKRVSEAEVADYMEFVEDRPFNDKEYPLDSTKLHSLGWRPSVTWDQGLQQTIAWYQNEDNLSRWSSLSEALQPFPTGSKYHRYQHPPGQVPHTCAQVS